MRTFFILTGLYFSAAFGQSQLLSFDAGLNTGLTNLVFFQHYSDAYNTALDGTLKNKLGSMKFSNGFSLGSTFMSNALYSEFEFESKYASTSSSFIEKAQGVRHINAKHRTGSIYLGYFDGGDDYFFSIAYMFGFSRINLDSYRKYPSGEKSFGDENATNGKYIGQNLTMGLKLDYNKEISDRLFWYAGIKLGFSMQGQSIKEEGLNEGFYFPGMVYTEGIPSMIRTGTIHAGLKFIILNSF